MTDDSLETRCAALRQEVRSFLEQEIASGAIKPQCDAWIGGFDKQFARRMGAKGWIGMTWPKKYGGQERSQLERFVVVEELLATGAPVGSYFAADRQIGPMFLRNGSEEQKQLILPRLVKGELTIAVGLSEPDSGSDLASVRTRATRVGDKWVINGTKIWTSFAHESDYVIVFCRTSESATRHGGLSQLIVKLPDPRVRMRPVKLLSGEHHFNQVYFDDVEVPASMLLGEEGGAWGQISQELGLERSGPERFLSTFPLYLAAVDIAKRHGGEAFRRTIGSLAAQMWSLRCMSLDIARMLEAGQQVGARAAMVKDLGTRLEGDLIEALRLHLPPPSRDPAKDPAGGHLAYALLHMPGYTLRGGTNEILRGIIARELGLR